MGGKGSGRHASSGSTASRSSGGSHTHAATGRTNSGADDMRTTIGKERAASKTPSATSGASAGTHTHRDTGRTNSGADDMRTTIGKERAAASLTRQVEGVGEVRMTKAGLVDKRCRVWRQGLVDVNGNKIEAPTEGPATPLFDPEWTRQVENVAAEIQTGSAEDVLQWLAAHEARLNALAKATEDQCVARLSTIGVSEFINEARTRFDKMGLDESDIKEIFNRSNLDKKRADDTEDEKKIWTYFNKRLLATPISLSDAVINILQQVFDDMVKDGYNPAVTERVRRSLRITHRHYVTVLDALPSSEDLAKSSVVDDMRNTAKDDETSGLLTHTLAEWRPCGDVLELCKAITEMVVSTKPTA